MAGTVVADTLRADSTSTLVLRNGVASTPPTVQDSAGTEIGTFCRAWVNFNGNSGSVAARASFNISSVTRTASGAYTIVMTTALTDANYVVAGMAQDAAGGATAVELGSTANTSTNLYIFNRNSSVGVQDNPIITVAVFR